ncbi:MAG: decaprenyl-phosphate phosphoribosyltransferase [Myxococcales bacterium]|nr:decaprenyl-phosphate phosphoribosyltransferase [Myxococcales bacterium]
MPGTIGAHIKAMRPKQWTKNVFVFGAPVFAQRLGDAPSMLNAVLAFVGFACVSSSIYLINDILDYEQDKLHPTKRNRPIAAGLVGRRTAVGLAALLAPLGLGIGWSLNLPTMTVLAVYYVTNLAYSVRLKHIALVDVFIIAFGFLLRVVAGAMAIAVPVSAWLLVTSFFLALFMAFGKRRGELAALGEGAVAHRANLADVTLGFLDQSMAALAAMTVMSYALYTIDPAVMARLGTDGLVLTVPLVLFGVFRYLNQVHQGKGGSPTTLVLTDRVVQLTGVVWLGLVIYFVYANVRLGLIASAL